MSEMPSLVNLFSPKNIIIFMLVFTRLSGLIATAPFFSTVSMPNQIKIWFCATIAFIMYPVISAKAHFVIPNSMPEFIVLMLLEFGIGFLIGFIANLLFVGAQMVGELISIQMGLSMAQVFDPATGTSTPIYSTFYVYLVTLVFLSTRAYEYLFAALFKSFFALPIGFSGVLDQGMTSAIVKLSAHIFQIAFGLAMPIFSVLLVCDILLGMASKILPQMNIFMVSLPFKIFLGIVLMLMFLKGSVGYLQEVSVDYLKAILGLFT